MNICKCPKPTRVDTEGQCAACYNPVGVYKPWAESSYPVSALAEQEGLCPRLVTNLYWAQCRVRERYSSGDVDLLEAAEEALRAKVRSKNRINGWKVPYRRVYDALLQIAAEWRPVKL